MKKELKKWVIESIKRGYTKTEIKKYLKNHGYSSEYISLVDEFFKEFEKNKKERNMIILFISLIIILIFISFIFPTENENKIPNMSINECIRKYTNPGDTIISWWDWGNLIEENGRKPVIKTPSIEYLKYTVNPNFSKDELSDSNITMKVAHLLTTNNTLIIKRIMKSLNSSFILIVPPYNKYLLPILMENTETECDNIECTFSYTVTRKKYKCFPVICHQNLTYLLIKNVC